MNRITGADVIAFVEAGLWGGKRQFGPASALGFANDTGIVAGVVFHNWEPDSGVIELSSYSGRRSWLTKGRLHEVFGYAFNGLGLRMCIARTAADNARVVRIWRALGASQHRLPDLRGEGQDEIVCLLRKQDFYNKFPEAS